MRDLVVSAMGFVLAGAAGAAPPPMISGDVSAPPLKVGDSWVFDQTTAKGQTGFQHERLDMLVERLNDDTMMLGIKPDGSPGAFEDHLVGTDWSHRRLVDGKDTTTNRPFTFPMAVGATWSVDFVDPTRRGAQISNHVHEVYKVVGWETVTVPAGTFRAIKVEAKGIDSATVQIAAAAVGGVVAGPAGSTAVTQTRKGGQSTLVRQTYSELYYVPEMKTYVKSVEEQYTPDSVRVYRQTQVLISSKLAE